MNAYEKWFRTFIEEKELTYEDWYFEIKGNPVWTNSNEAVELIAKITDKGVQESVKKTIVMLDFKNGDINHFLHYAIKGHMELVIGAEEEG